MGCGSASVGGAGQGNDMLTIVTRPALQRPRHYVPGLRSTPWWRAQDVPETAVLEAHSAAITNECDDLVLLGRLRLHSQSPGGSLPTLTDGDWNMFELWTHTRPHLGNLIEAPVTARLLSAMPNAVGHRYGLAYFSVLQPGVHVAAHCGPTNTRIRVHLGVRIPAGASMRVGNETRSWEEGRCLVFDDSWEHEATNPSGQPRAVLLVDVWHPELSAEQREEVDIVPRFVRTSAQSGWVRRGLTSAADGACHDPIDPAIFAMLGPSRIARMTAATRRAAPLDFPAVGAAARRVLAVLTTGVDGLASAAPQQPFAITDDVLWAELTLLARNAAEHGLEPADVVELAIVCSICWRTRTGHADTMADFLDRWPPDDKQACANELVALGTASRMITALGNLHVAGGPPPFGALVPMLCAAHRRSSTFMSE